MFQFHLLVCLLLFYFRSWKRTKSLYEIRKQQNQNSRKIHFFYFIWYSFQEKTPKNIIKLYFSSFLLAYMGGFYEFHVLSIVKDSAVKALWEVRSVEDEAVLLKEGEFFSYVFQVFCTLSFHQIQLLLAS